MWGGVGGGLTTVMSTAVTGILETTNAILLVNLIRIALKSSTCIQTTICTGLRQSERDCSTT